MILIAVLYHLLLFIGDCIVLGGFKFVDEVHDLLVMDTKFSGCRADLDFIFDDGYECRVDILRIYVELIC